MNRICFFSLLLLSVSLIGVSCAEAFEDVPRPHKQDFPQAVPDSPEVEDPGLLASDDGPCRHLGKVYYHPRTSDCGPLILLRNRTWVRPVNAERLEPHLRNGMRVSIGFEYVHDEPRGECRHARSVFVYCFKDISREGMSPSSDRRPATN